MSGRRAKAYLIVMFLIISAGYLLYEIAHKKRVLILHSYYTDYSWVNEVSEGVKRILDDEPYWVRWHYMDTKRHPNEEFKLRAGDRAQKLINNWGPDVIIAIDDNAQKYVAHCFTNGPQYQSKSSSTCEELPPCLKTFRKHPVEIVFAGVGASPKDYGYDQATNVRGILERIPLQAIKAGIIEMFPEDRYPRPIRLFHISDDSTSGRHNREQIESIDWGPEIQLLEPASVSSFPQWQHTLNQSQSDSDLILLTNYHTLHTENTNDSSDQGDCDPNREENTSQHSANDSIKLPKEVITWTLESINKPVIGAWGFYVQDGGMLAIAVSPYEQGEVAAREAIKVLNGRSDMDKVSDPRFRRSEQFVIYMRESDTTRFGIKVPPIYEAFARAMGAYRE